MMIEMTGRPVTILVAEDSPDDRLLTKRAFKDSKVANDLHFVEDGEMLLEYLKRRGKYAGPNPPPMPDLILLDLNMPRKDGREALGEIKKDPRLARIPVIILTTSNEEQDILQSYNLGVNSFITKPVSFEQFMRVMVTFEDYWLQVVTLPLEN